MSNIKQLKLRDGSEFYPYIIAGCIPDGAIDASKLNSNLANLINSKANASDVYTKNEVYNTSEIDTLLSVKANANDVYTKSYIDALMDNYYTKLQVYTKTEVDALLEDTTIVYTLNGTSGTFTAEQLNNIKNKFVILEMPMNDNHVKYTFYKLYNADSGISNIIPYRVFEIIPPTSIGVSIGSLMCSGVNINYTTGEWSFIEQRFTMTDFYNKTQVDTLLNAKQNTLTTTSVTSGTLNEAVGFDTNGNLVRGTAGGGGSLYNHLINLKLFYSQQGAIYRLQCAINIISNSNVECNTMKKVVKLYEDSVDNVIGSLVYPNAKGYIHLSSDNIDTTFDGIMLYSNSTEMYPSFFYCKYDVTQSSTQPYFVRKYSLPNGLIDSITVTDIVKPL